MFFSGFVIDLLGDCWRSFDFFIPCVQITPAEASMAARRGSPVPLLLSGTHSQSCTAACTNLRKRYRLGLSSARLVLAHVSQITKAQHKHLCWHKEEGDVHDGMSRDESAFFRDSVHLSWPWNYSINSSSVKKQNETDLLCKMLQDPPNFSQYHFIISIIYCLGRQRI